MYQVKWEVIEKPDQAVKRTFKSVQQAVTAAARLSNESREVIAFIDENKDGFREKNIKNKINKLKTKLIQTQTKIKRKEYEKIKKLSLKKCQNCSSKINTTYLKNIDCLVCGKAMLGTPAKRSLLEIHNKIKFEENKLETLKKETNQYYVRISIQIKESA